MAGFSTYLSNKLLDHTLKIAAFTVPGNIYVGLSVTEPLDDATGLSEPVGNGYARVAANTKFAAAAAGSAASDESVVFPTASGSWGTLAFWALFDAAAAGNLLLYGPLAIPKIVASGDVASFNVGALVISLD